MISLPQKEYDLNEVRLKIRVYCSYRERSQTEVRDKLYGYGLIPLAVEELLTELIQENFLNEERFARAYVRGKFGIKKWGRQKIRQGLYRHHLSDYILEKAFSEIDDEIYEKALRDLIVKKKSKIKGMTDFKTPMAR
ncbi:MAG: regulatory protein RecX [Owenweeksia sp.]|nr:regulatory protein RecX [Owenweeksia sp.]